MPRSPIEVLQNSLVGKGQSAKQRLSEYWSSVQPYVSWYPSAGRCFRDVLLWNMASVYAHFPDRPSVFIHTDYFSRGRKISEGFSRDEGGTRIEVRKVYDLDFADDGLHYEVNAQYAKFREKA